MHPTVPGSRGATAPDSNREVKCDLAVSIGIDLKHSQFSESCISDAHSYREVLKQLVEQGAIGSLLASDPPSSSESANLKHHILDTLHRVAVGFSSRSKAAEQVVDGLVAWLGADSVRCDHEHLALDCGLHIEISSLSPDGLSAIRQLESLGLVEQVKGTCTGTLAIPEELLQKAAPNEEKRVLARAFSLVKFTCSRAESDCSLDSLERYGVLQRDRHTHPSAGAVTVRDPERLLTIAAAIHGDLQREREIDGAIRTLFPEINFNPVGRRFTCPPEHSKEVSKRLKQFGRLGVIQVSRLSRTSAGGVEACFRSVESEGLRAMVDTEAIRRHARSSACLSVLSGEADFRDQVLDTTVWEYSAKGVALSRPSLGKVANLLKSLEAQGIVEALVGSKESDSQRSIVVRNAEQLEKLTAEQEKWTESANALGRLLGHSCRSWMPDGPLRRLHVVGLSLVGRDALRDPLAQDFTHQPDEEYFIELKVPDVAALNDFLSSGREETVSFRRSRIAAEHLSKFALDQNFAQCSFVPHEGYVEAGTNYLGLRVWDSLDSLRRGGIIAFEPHERPTWNWSAKVVILDEQRLAAAAQIELEVMAERLEVVELLKALTSYRFSLVNRGLELTVQDGDVALRTLENALSELGRDGNVTVQQVGPSFRDFDESHWFRIDSYDLKALRRRVASALTV